MKMKIVKKNPLLQKLRGFQKSPRDRLLLLHFGELTQEELLLYELGLAITDWDSNHVETYGTFYATNGQLADVLGLKSDSTVSRTRNSLFSKKYFQLREDGRIIVKDFHKWELRKRFENSED